MMGKLFKNIRGVIQPAVFYVPFTLYFLLFGVAVLLANSWLTSRALIPDSSFADIFKLLIKTGIWFLVAIVAVALISVLVAYLVFLWKKRKNSLAFFIETKSSQQNKDNNPVQQVQISVAPIIKPLLGFIKLRLQYDSENYSDKFVLAEKKQQKLIPTSFEGVYQWNLPQIREYHVEKLIIYFEDLFQFFSFTVSLPVQSRFYTHPFAPKVQDFSVTPQKTEDTETRIEELKRVEGEYLNYKNFENNDDVRRIVWKIYAKNKELVVRIPEVLDPYASHAYMYVSFFNNFDLAGSNVAEIFFLNYYKSMLWAIYGKLCAQGFAVKYVPDQILPSKVFTEEKESVQYNITTSNWQSDKDLKTFAGAKDAAVVIVSSLSNPAEVEELLNSRAGSVLFIFIRLSHALQKSYLVGLLQWLFVQQEKNDVEVYKTNWRLSLLRPKILQNEKKLEALFVKHSKAVVI